MYKIEKIKNQVKKECESKNNIYGMNAYDYHFKSVVKYAKTLARKTGADEEIVEIAAWLHDIGSIIGDYDNHHVAGAAYAEKLLRQYHYPEDKIARVKHCIKAHRGSKNIKKDTIEAESLADADALSHFDNIHDLFRLALVTKKLNSEDARKFVLGKLKNSWQKLSPEAKKIIKQKYEAIKVVLKYY